jgi:hypothetical protein
MQKRIREIRQEISLHPARNAWDKGVKLYAKELFEDYLEGLNLTDGSVRIGKIKERDLLNGAQDWHQYSWGGCAEIYNSGICEKLCNKSEQKKTQNGTLPPNANEKWLDVQARALFQAAQIVLDIVNRRDEVC